MNNRRNMSVARVERLIGEGGAKHPVTAIVKWVGREGGETWFERESIYRKG